MPAPRAALSLLALGAACSEYKVVERGIVDTFEQGGEFPKADVLFVVDDSSSMGEEQARLGASFSSFTAVLGSTLADFRLAVTTTDPARPGFVGPVLTAETPSLDDAFLAQVLVGTGGARTEEGLTQAVIAVQPSTSPGFLRDGARLVVIVFSDEDDHSPLPVQSYVDELQSLAGAGGAFVHAIVGDLPAGCVAGVLAADAGPRYAEAATLTEGRRASICAPDHAAFLEQIAFDIAGWNDTFYLSRLPEPDTLLVHVDDVEIPERETDGWTWDIGENAIVFHGRAVPRPGMKVTVSYEVVEGAPEGEPPPD